MIQNIKRVGLRSLLIGSGAVALAGVSALASDGDISSSGGGSNLPVVSFMAVSIIFVTGVVVVGFGSLIFWIFMLIDALKRTNWQDDNQRTIWLVVLIASFVLGAWLIASIVYYFAVRRSLGKAQASVPQAHQTPPAGPTQSK